MLDEQNANLSAELERIHRNANERLIMVAMHLHVCLYSDYINVAHSDLYAIKKSPEAAKFNSELLFMERVPTEFAITIACHSTYP